MAFDRIICPSVSAHATLRQPLTTGEQAALRFFDENLPSEWEIYIQPHLNGLRPDFVVLNPRGGIGVFEIKDWDLSAMHYFVRQDAWGHAALWAERDGKEFCLQSQNPVTKVNLYKKEIFDLYCPRIKPGEGWATITAGVIFPFAYAGQVRSLLSPFLQKQEGEKYARYQPISGIQELKSGNLSAVFPESNRAYSKLMSESLAADLRGWLVEPDFSHQQRLPLGLDKAQRQLATSRTETGYRRIKGPAGSGKSLVLAARAAALANEGKSVLVATFNITLWHYLRDLIVREIASPAHLKNVTFTHFHLWCKHVCYEAGWDKRYDELVASQEADTLSVGLPMLADEAVSTPGAVRFDAILVDEGQDYQPLWWNVLRKALAPGGEMLLVADATQDIYGHAHAWTDEVMTGAGFSGGRWAELAISYRLPPDAMNYAMRFAETYLPKETIDLPRPEQGSLDLYPCHLRWVQCDSASGDGVCATEIARLMVQTGTNRLANADITVLTGDMASGQKVVAHLSRDRIRCVDTFGEDHRRRKMGFYMGDGRIKATTLHSFKGWEARMLVVFVTSAAHVQSLALIYAGLTRLKRDELGSWLTVVCCAPELAEFGASFPDFQTGSDTAEAD